MAVDTGSMSANEQLRLGSKAAIAELSHGQGQSEMMENDSYNLNSPYFNPDMFLHQLIKEATLPQLMDTEARVYSQIQALDSEMQTLVYENYNKFIAATDTVRKMKQDFRQMEEEMQRLATNMSHIAAFSGSVALTLQERRDEIGRLSNTHVMLKKLQFLFELPAQLNDAIEKENYAQAVEHAQQWRRLWQQRHQQRAAGLAAVRAECDASVARLVSALQRRLQQPQSSCDQLTETVRLLLRLEQPAEPLCRRVLEHAETRLSEQLAKLTRQAELAETAGDELPQDVLEFVDVGCSNFLSDLCLFVTSFRDLFLNDDRGPQSGDASALLGEFAIHQTSLLLAAAERRLLAEPAASGAPLMARALDRLHRRLLASASLLPGRDQLLSGGMRVVAAAAERRCRQSLTLLTGHLEEAVSAARQALLLQPAAALPEQLAALIGALAEKMRALVTSLQAFIQPELSFGMTAAFRETFCRQHVRETLVVGFFRHLAATCGAFCEPGGGGGGGERASPGVLLLLSRVCRDLETSTVHYLLNFVDDQLGISDKSGLTPLSSVTGELGRAAHTLLNHYVRLEGLSVSQMLRQSVVSRDWQLANEPRAVRSVMRRVCEQLSAVDAQVGALYEDSARGETTANSSDSSRRTGPGAGGRLRHTWSSYTPSQVDTGLAANIQKLFSERIEIFAPVEFSRASILTGVIKISLKTLLECVRLKTFSKFGLQQVQVDVHYLQLNLWRFVADEKLLHGLLDEVLGSAIHRCLQPVLMEFSVIEVMCERS